jgi:hypothetical protein
MVKRELLAEQGCFDGGESWIRAERKNHKFVEAS